MKRLLIPAVEAAIVLGFFIVAYALRGHVTSGSPLEFSLDSLKLTAMMMLTFLAPLISAVWAYQIQIGVDSHRRRTGVLILIVCLIALPASQAVFTEILPAALGFIGLKLDWARIAQVDSAVLFLFSLYGLHRSDVVPNLMKPRVRKVKLDGLHGA